MDVLTFGIFFTGILGLDSKRVSAEVVSLSLEKVGWQVLRSIAVIEAQCSAEGGRGYSPEGPFADNVPPTTLCIVDCAVEEVVKEKVLKIRILAESCRDILQEDRANDTPTTPHERDFRLVKFPRVFLGGLN